MRKGYSPAVMGIPGRAALNMLRTIQRKLETDVSIGLLPDRIGHRPWILVAALRPETDFAFALPAYTERYSISDERPAMSTTRTNSSYPSASLR